MDDHWAAAPAPLIFGSVAFVILVASTHSVVPAVAGRRVGAL
jgi:hypothetical protein